MIKTKEDLMNTAVFCPHGELRDLYIQKCKEFGIKWNHHNLNIDNYSLLYIDRAGNLQGVISEGDDCYDSAKRLTLEDLKPTPSPRTRTTYEKVTEDFFFLKGEFERGELYCLGDEGSYYVCNTIVNLALAMESDICYRKVETSMDWKEILMEILPLGYSDGVVDCNASDRLRIKGFFNKGQAKVLAEGILKAIGESGEGSE